MYTLIISPTVTSDIFFSLVLKDCVPATSPQELQCWSSMPLIWTPLESLARLPSSTPWRAPLSFVLTHALVCVHVSVHYNKLDLLLVKWFWTVQRYQRAFITLHCFLFVSAGYISIDLSSALSSFCHNLNISSLNMCLCFRRDHHHIFAGPRAEIRIHPHRESCRWRGWPATEDWHCHGKCSQFICCSTNS